MTGLESTYLVLLLISLVLSAFFSSSEIAYINLQRIRLKHLQDSGVPGASRVAKILESPERFLSVVLTSLSVTETVLVTCGSLLFVSLLGDATGTAVGIVVIAIVLLLFVKVVPKTIAAQHAESLALRYAPAIEVTSKVVSPVTTVLGWITARIPRPEGARTIFGALLSKEELHTAISMGEAGGAVDQSSAQMLKRVVKFGDRWVREVMIPRTEVVWVEQGATLADFQQVYSESPVLRYPIYEGNFDNVTGVLITRDVHVALAQGSIDQKSIITDFQRPVYFVPGTKLVGELFTEMRAKKFSMAVVVSEYGGTSGIVTIEELVEEIVGEVSEELVGADKGVEIISEHAIQIEANMRIDEANERLGLGLPEDEYETVGGFVLHMLGHLPEEGEHVTYGNVRLMVTEVKGLRIVRLMVTKEVPEAGPEQSHEPPSDESPTSMQ
ncbi:MAG: HlyC/CorC family transporter [Dehalococcoidia bacterium]|nr:HlyC/CorC family transporter [Dehalococcoidia bacterium]